MWVRRGEEERMTGEREKRRVEREEWERRRQGEEEERVSEQEENIFLFFVHLFFRPLRTVTSKRLLFQTTKVCTCACTCVCLHFDACVLSTFFVPFSFLLCIAFLADFFFLVHRPLLFTQFTRRDNIKYLWLSQSHSGLVCYVQNLQVCGGEEREEDRRKEGGRRGEGEKRNVSNKKLDHLIS